MKAILTSFLLLSCTFVYAQKKLTFEKVAPMPNEAYAFAYAQSSRDIMAFGGGEDFSRFSAFIHVYDAKVDFWVSTGIKGVPRIKYSTGTYMEAYNGVLLVGGIQPYGASVGLVEEIRMLSLDDFSITKLGVLPEAAKDMGLASDGKKAYFFGGSTSMEVNMNGTSNYTFSNKFFVYDMEIGHLEKLPDLPKAMETAGGIYEGNLYVFGGFNRNPLTDIYQYNLEKKTWTALEPFNKPVSSYALAQYDRYFILAGDYHDGNQLIVYDTKTQKAEYFKTNFAGRHMGASVIGEYLHVYGGFNNVRGDLIRNDHYKISIRKLINSLDQ